LPRPRPFALHHRGHQVFSTARLCALAPRRHDGAALPTTRASATASARCAIFQYAQTTHFHYVYIGRVGLRTQARTLAAAARDEWIAVALRRETAGAKRPG
jgi:hypothetical protein